MFSDPRREESSYFSRTGILPIMHVIAIRQPIYEANPWIARNLFKAFEAARERSLARIFDRQASRLFVPWLPEYAKEGLAAFKSDYYPYGIDKNRTCLDAFLKWSFEQGITKRRLAAEELFAPELGAAFKV